MITRIRLDNGAWAGRNLVPTLEAHAEAFDGNWQRENAFKWARSGLGAKALFVDVITSVLDHERLATPRILCTCGKVLQDGLGPLSHGLCGPCCKDEFERVCGKGDK